jgi:outer membrane biosynthesis protein TonB
MGSKGADCAPERSDEEQRPAGRNSPDERVEEVPPRFKGNGRFAQSARYPKEAVKAQMEGMVFVKFRIDRRGRTFGREIVSTRLRPRRSDSGDSSLDDARARSAILREALRTVSRARFEPGLRAGEPVCVKMNTSIRWKLN